MCRAAVPHMEAAPCEGPHLRAGHGRRAGRRGPLAAPPTPPPAMHCAQPSPRRQRAEGRAKADGARCTAADAWRASSGSDRRRWTPSPLVVKRGPHLPGHGQRCAAAATAGDGPGTHSRPHGSQRRCCHCPPPPPCDIPSGCCSFTGPWTVTRSSLRMFRRVAAFCRPLRPVLLLVSFPRSRSPVVGVLGLC